MYVQNEVNKPRTIEELMGVKTRPEAQERIEKSLQTLEQSPHREASGRGTNDKRPMTLEDLRRRPATGFTETFPERTGRTMGDLPVPGDKQVPFAVHREPHRNPVPTRTLFDLTGDPMNGSRFLAALEDTTKRDRVRCRDIYELLNTPGNPFIDPPTASSPPPASVPPANQTPDASAPPVPPVLPVPPAPPKTKPSTEKRSFDSTINYAVVLKALREKVEQKGKQWDWAIPKFQESLGEYNKAARTFSETIKRLQAGLSPRGRALLKRDIEELQGFKQVVQNTMKDFHIGLSSTK